MQEMDLDQMRQATSRYLTRRRLQEQSATQDAEAHRKRMEAYEQSIAVRCAHHALELSAWMKTAEFEETTKLLTAANRHVDLGNDRYHEGGILSAALTGNGFVLVQGDSRMLTGGHDGLKTVGLCFFKAIEEMDHRGSFPGGIIAFIRRDVFKVVTAAHD